MFLKFDMNLKGVDFLYNFVGCMKENINFVSLYIDLRILMLIF